MQLQFTLQADVSLHLLLEVLVTIPAGSMPIIARLVQEGRALGLIRPASRLTVIVSQIEPHMLCPLPDLKDLARHARCAQRNPYPSHALFVSLFSTQLLM